MIAIVTENLINNLDLIPFDTSNTEKITIEELNKNTVQLFENTTQQFIYDEFFTISKIRNLNVPSKKNLIIQIKKNNLSKLNELNEEVDVIYPLEAEKSLYPWDLTKVLYNKNLKITDMLINEFSGELKKFQFFLFYFQKEILRIKLLKEFDNTETSLILNEKEDFKYKDASGKVTKLSLEQIDHVLLMIFKIEKMLNKYPYEPEKAKRFFISCKRILQF